MIRYLLRTARWMPFFVSAALAAGYFVVATDGSVDAMRVVTVLLTLGCCAALNDPAATLLAASPTPLRHRRVRQAAVTLIPTALVWLIALVITLPGGEAARATDGLVLEAVTLLALVLATALVAQRFGISEPSEVAGAVTAGAVLVLVALPSLLSLFTAPNDPDWNAAHQRWVGLLISLVVVAVCAVRDPAARAVHRLGERPRAERDDLAPNDLL